MIAAYSQTISSAEAARRAGITVKSLSNRRCAGTGPPVHMFATEVRYVPEELDLWAAKIIRRPRQCRRPRAGSSPAVLAGEGHAEVSKPTRQPAEFS